MSAPKKGLVKRHLISPCSLKRWNLSLVAESQSRSEIYFIAEQLYSATGTPRMETAATTLDQQEHQMYLEAKELLRSVEMERRPRPKRVQYLTAILDPHSLTG